MYLFRLLLQWFLETQWCGKSLLMCVKFFNIFNASVTNEATNLFIVNLWSSKIKCQTENVVNLLNTLFII